MKRWLGLWAGQMDVLTGLPGDHSSSPQRESSMFCLGRALPKARTRGRKVISDFYLTYYAQQNAPKPILLWAPYLLSLRSFWFHFLQKKIPNSHKYGSWENFVFLWQMVGVKTKRLSVPLTDFQTNLLSAPQFTTTLLSLANFLTIFWFANKLGRMASISISLSPNPGPKVILA